MENTSLPAFRQVIKQAIAQDKTWHEVLHERFPIGPGGVGHANRRLHKEILQEIADFYAPREAPEPDVRYGW